MHGFQSWLPILLEAAYAQPTPQAQPESQREVPADRQGVTGVCRPPFLARGATVVRARSAAHAGDVFRDWRAAEHTRRPLVGTITASARGGPLAFARCLGAAAAGGREATEVGPGLPAGSGVAIEPLTKLLFSATLTRSAAKLAPLRLESAAYFCVSGARYATPATLREWMLSCPAQVRRKRIVHPGIQFSLINLRCFVHTAHFTPFHSHWPITLPHGHTAGADALVPPQVRHTIHTARLHPA
jgi:hypothetical protein